MRTSRALRWAVWAPVVVLLGLSAPVSASPYDVSVINGSLWVLDGTVETDVYALPGETVTICVWVDPDNNGDGYAGQFDFLIGYNPGAMAFLDARKGTDLGADWEYFTWRTGIPLGPCAACPSGYVRMLGIADLMNGTSPPEETFALSGCVTEIDFQVTNDWNYLNTVHPIPFISIDCEDNVIASIDGDSLFLPAGGYIAGDVYDSDSCASEISETVTQNITYHAGALVVYEPWSDVGDINLDGIANTVADAILFSRFLSYGRIVLDPIWSDDQLLFSDVNCDSLTASLEDLSFLLNVIRGDLQPCQYAGINPPPAGPGPQYSEDDTIKVVSVAVEAGDAVTIDFYMRNVDSVGAFDFRLLYDPAVLEPIVSDTLFRNGDTALTLATPVFPRSGNFDVIYGAIPEPGILQFVALDFQGTPGTQLAPGAGVTVSTQWHVLGSAAPQISSLAFAADPEFPNTHNTIVDPHAAIWKRPVMTGGYVNIGGAVCNCPAQCDLDQDGFYSSLDLGLLIDVLFAGRPDIVSPDCPAPGGDFDCDLYTTSLDLGKMIEFLFAGGPGPCDPCAP